MGELINFREYLAKTQEELQEFLTALDELALDQLLKEAA